MYTFGFIVGSIIQKSVKCIHSATKEDWGPRLHDIEEGGALVDQRLSKREPSRNSLKDVTFKGALGVSSLGVCQTLTILRNPRKTCIRAFCQPSVKSLGSEPIEVLTN